MAEKNDRKKRATAAAVAAMTAGSVVVGGLFSDPNDLLQNDAPAPITATLDASGDGGNGDDDSGAATENVIWRMENGQLEGYRARRFVVKAGHHNSRFDSRSDKAKAVERIVELIKLRHKESLVEVEK